MAIPTLLVRTDNISYNKEVLQSEGNVECMNSILENATSLGE